jgi:thousand and one amino acid protein kinase
LNVRYRQLESQHGLLRRYHEQTRNVEERHMDESQTMRNEHMRAQHSTEEQNQTAYTKHATDNLRKRHALQSRQQPKDLRVCLLISTVLLYTSLILGKGNTNS